MLRAANEACPAGAVPAIVAAGSEAVSGVPSAVLLKEAVYNAVGVRFSFPPPFFFQSSFLALPRPPSSLSPPAANETKVSLLRTQRQLLSISQGGGVDKWRLKPLIPGVSMC
jgi:hypothetical protein